MVPWVWRKQGKELKCKDAHQPKSPQWVQQSNAIIGMYLSDSTRVDWAPKPGAWTGTENNTETFKTFFTDFVFYT